MSEMFQDGINNPGKVFVSFFNTFLKDGYKFLFRFLDNAPLIHFFYFLFSLCSLLELNAQGKFENQ